MKHPFFLTPFFMVIITGTSQGIGWALATFYLEKGEKVIGIGRTSTIQNSNYEHIYADLSQPDEVAAIQLPTTSESLIFVHNAGILGEVTPFTNQHVSNLNCVMQVNLFSGAALMQQILHQTPLQHPLQLVIISSGAGKRAIPSWSAYCASKAAADLWLQTVCLEEIEKGRLSFACYAISPGVVDTGMQEQIRSVAPADFSSLKNFQALKRNDQLATPREVAQKIDRILELPLSKHILWNLKETKE
jgi:benzil reductase ((S)-benzoin forming)